MIKSHPISSKTIVINATNIGYKLNGIGIYTLNIIKKLSKLSTNDTFIIYLNKSCKPHLNNFYFPPNFRMKWVSKFISPDKKFFGHLLRLIYSNVVSIRHFNCLQFNTSPLEVCFFSKNQIVTVHDVIPLLFKEYHKKQYIFYKVVLKYVLKNVKMVITPSAYTKNLVCKYYGLTKEEIQVIYLGVDKVQVKNAMNDTPGFPYMLYVGRINEMKNVGRIIESYTFVRRILSIDLIIAGDDKRKFYKLLDNLNCNTDVKNGVKFYENISEDEKYSLMRNASIFIYPTLYEGFGLPPLEAMINACPVITSDNSSMPEVCGKAAYYIDPENVNEIAKGIVEVLTNVKLRNQLVKNGLERAYLFSWEKTVKEHLHVINKVLGNWDTSQKNEKVPELKHSISERVTFDQL